MQEIHIVIATLKMASLEIAINFNDQVAHACSKACKPDHNDEKPLFLAIIDNAAPWLGEEIRQLFEFSKIT